jgi:dTDP-4-dehydrorhamnose reductase
VNVGGVIILGARSWIGFRLAQAFAEQGIPVIGTTSNATPSVPFAAANLPPLTPAADVDGFNALIRHQRPRIVFNLLRGENTAGLEAHLQAARLCEEIGSRYVYASSALVFEGHHPDVILDEQARPTAVTPYGAFKAECERRLADGHPDGNWQVLRFTSIQGWSPWKPSRNEAFLTRLSKGETIAVDIGIVQNRMLDLDFARQVRDNALLPAARGFLHLGADDASEEVDFLRRVATAFGWPASRVQPGQPKDCHIALDCARTHSLTAGRWRSTEKHTLQGLLREPRLAHLIARN